jgi:predicted nucleic acid-binding protein
MTYYLLDTDALIDFSRGVEPATSWILSWIDGADIVAVCAVSVAEFYSGLSAEQAQRWQPFISSLTYWDVGRQAAMQSGQERYRLARGGRAITTTDALIACVAREQGATLVTGNVKDFPMMGLSVLSVR